MPKQAEHNSSDHKPHKWIPVESAVSPSRTSYQNNHSLLPCLSSLTLQTEGIPLWEWQVETVCSLQQEQYDVEFKRRAFNRLFEQHLINTEIIQLFHQNVQESSIFANCRPEWHLGMQNLETLVHSANWWFSSSEIERLGQSKDCDAWVLLQEEILLLRCTTTLGTSARYL